MIDFILSHLFHRYTLDLSVIARRLADEYLNMFAPEVAAGTVGYAAYGQWARTRYMQWATKVGLPGGAQEQTARLSWQIIDRARKQQERPGEAVFSFYD